MSVTTDYLGQKPEIDLHVGGLKIREAMVCVRLMGMELSAVTDYALQHSPAMLFQSLNVE